MTFFANWKCEHGQLMEQISGLFRNSVWFLSITAPVKLLADEFDVWSIFYGQMSLAAASHIYIFHEVIKVCNNLTTH